MPAKPAPKSYPARRKFALRTEERTAAQSVQSATKLTGEHRTRLSTLESQITDLTARYPEGIESAKTTAQIAFVQAEARVTTTKAELPPDFEKLPERNKRAAAALQNREHFRKAYLKPLLHAGWLVPTLPDKPRSPRQRYLTTALGHTWLARIAPLHLNLSS